MIFIDDKKLINLINKGVFYTDAQEYKLAIKCYDEILAQYPNNAVALLNKATIFIIKGDFAGALTLINSGLNQDPQHSEGWVNKALCLHAIDKADKLLRNVGRNTEYALECCDNAIELNRLYPLAWEMKCEILNETLEFEKALDVANDALHTGIVNSRIFQRKGDTLYYLGRFDVELLNFNSVIFLEPENEIANISRRMCLDAIAQLPSPLKSNQLVFENEIDERFLPNLNQEFAREENTKSKDEDCDNSYISIDKIYREGFNASFLKYHIPYEKIKRINKINNVSTVQEIVNSNSKLLLLCGSGISFESPSNLPTGGQFIESLVKAIIPPSQARDQTLRQIFEVPSYKPPLLGFESLLQIVQDNNL